MPSRTPATLRRSVILDADGLSKLARRDRRVRAMIEQEVRDSDSALVVPLIVTTQALDGTNLKAVERILRDAHNVAPVDLERAREAAGLMALSGVHDAVDALVAVEALRRVPSVVITSDPDDIQRLLDVDERGQRVAVWSV